MTDRRPAKKNWTNLQHRTFGMMIDEKDTLQKLKKQKAKKKTKITKYTR